MYLKDCEEVVDEEFIKFNLIIFNMKGEKRLKEIRERLKEVLRDISPESKKYEIQYKPIKKYYSKETRTEVYIRPKDSPAYGLYLVSKSDPTKSFEIMDVFWPDIREKTPKYMEKYYGGSAFADRVKEGIEELQKRKTKIRVKPSKLETLMVISILSLLVGIFLVSNNLSGFVISNLSQSSSNWLSAVLLLAGITGSFFWLKSRKK